MQATADISWQSSKHNGWVHMRERRIINIREALSGCDKNPPVLCAVWFRDLWIPFLNVLRNRFWFRFRFFFSKWGFSLDSDFIISATDIGFGETLPNIKKRKGQKEKQGPRTKVWASKQPKRGAMRRKWKP
jgi:hypothetical protein